jgi:hypothetical protein
MNLYKILADIRAESSKLKKRAILAANKDNELLKEFLRMVYDPRLNYYITKLPKPGENVLEYPRNFDGMDLSDLLELSTRQVTGKAAKGMLAAKLAALDDEGKALLGYLIARDVDAGIAENSVLEVWPNLFFIPPYQRCASMDADLKERFGNMPFFYVQTKSDGQFCYAIKRSFTGTAGVDIPPAPQAMSRAGSLYPEWLAAHITYGLPSGKVAMGELLVVRSGKVLDRKTGNGILNSVLSGDGSKFNTTDEVAFVAWDMVTEQEFDAGRSDRPYKVRWTELTNTAAVDRISTWEVTSVKQANTIHAEHIARKEEGTVWKNPEMVWRDCSSGDKDMMKAKVVFEAEYEIINAYVHKKNPDMLGGFCMASSDRLVKFDVGSGFSDQQRLDYWSMLKDNPHAFDGTIATCEGNDIVTSKGKTTESVFLPIFVELRLDKKEADDRARVWAQFNAAKEGRKL